MVQGNVHYLVNNVTGDYPYFSPQSILEIFGHRFRVLKAVTNTSPARLLNTSQLIMALDIDWAMTVTASLKQPVFIGYEQSHRHLIVLIDLDP
jgi:hypothetical protein